MAIYGYARVSTIDQDLSLQWRSLKATGCDVTRAVKASGARRNQSTCETTARRVISWFS
jgi:DNA invertase Pin-like site-specific DNA recombinase